MLLLTRQKDKHAIMNVAICKNTEKKQYQVTLEPVELTVSTKQYVNQNLLSARLYWHEIKNVCLEFLLDEKTQDNIQENQLPAGFGRWRLMLTWNTFLLDKVVTNVLPGLTFLVQWQAIFKLTKTDSC